MGERMIVFKYLFQAVLMLLVVVGLQKWEERE